MDIRTLAPVPAGQSGSLYQTPFTVAGDAQVAGRLGVHWPVHFDVNDAAQVDAIIGRASELGAGYTTLNVSLDALKGSPQAYQALFDKLNHHAPPITPVVRIYEGAPSGQWDQSHVSRMTEAAVLLAEAGVDLIQIGNEPNIETGLREQLTDEERGWVDRLERREISERDIPQAIRDTLEKRRQQFHDASIANQVEALAQVKATLTGHTPALDAQVGLPPMAAGASNSFFTFEPGQYFSDMVGAVAQRERDTQGPIVDWISTHTYTWNDADPAGPGWKGEFPHGHNARGQMGWGPATSHAYEDIAQNLLGRSLTALSTEGGAGPDYFRANAQGQVDKAGTKRALSENYAQLHDDPRLTGCLWLDWESGPRDQWDMSALRPNAEGSFDEWAWSTVLTDFEDAASRARAGE
ncbi:hypothetical protein POL68_10575 [Stigmatella sp. ncwal1]|uniref:Glycoside hydrolase family 5 domain-containing protein n=1 Tax=Stigmatella ashevillensis TaxID=2995309 RepID=A0ABT5D5H4_9BACT|nr:hypothetical protein [Stigmatella ashevillena]MDC0708911.1 hypothetical protein [Stigmatella ashevillena]